MLIASHSTASDIRIWAFKATIVNIDDPITLFGDVRLGDTVRGDFAYDLEMSPSYSDVGAEYYDSPVGFHAIRMAIENPRTGETLRYALGSDASLFAEVTTDDSDYGDSNVLMWQFGVEPPRPGLWPIPFIQLSGENVLTETSLPTSFNLEDWPLAAVFLGAEGINDGITASIFSITPVSTGDFNQDGSVDADDLSQWQRDFGTANTSDADRDGNSDGADFLAWQRELGTSTGSLVAGQLSSVVPEPSAIMVLAMLSILSLLAIRRTC